MNDILTPLAYRYRPIDLSDFVGQKHLVGKDGPIRSFIKSKKLPSMVFWGPPGTGKTTLAIILSKELGYDFHSMSAVSSGKSMLLDIVKSAKESKLFSKKVVLFLDEIHRWNKAQQDVLLPYVESGLITLIGATTENPSFSLNAALLSRVKIFTFERHTAPEIAGYLGKVIKDLQKEKNFRIKKNVIDLIAEISNGDLRSALNILEITINLLPPKNKDITVALVKNAVQKQIYYDKTGDEHYNIISAIHKSLRSSNADAACYWIGRMLIAGEDPRYVARRLVRFASEDIGNAKPAALSLALTVYESIEKVGMPECNVFLMQLAIYLANCPKDNTAYKVWGMVAADVEKFGNLPVPLHLRNAPTKLMEGLGYGKGYEYDHDLPGKKSDQQCMPDKLKNRKYLDV
ncbi:replication-associated recombination protein A [Candidatus Dojkabacteria bacterium]|nr:replication-associated recombination protein A [Candidatus Dojkabacteria bacterium]